LRAVLTTLAVFLILVLSTALVGPYLIDWSAHRAEVEKQLSHALGQSVVISGPINAALLPTPYLRITNIAIGGARGGAALSCQNMYLELALASLIRGEFHFTDALFERPRVVLQRGANGEVVPPRFDVKVAPESVGLDTITLTDATIEIGGAKNRPPLKIEGLSLDAQADSLRGPFKGKGRATLPNGAASFHFATGAAKRNVLPLKLVADFAASGEHADFDGAVSVGGASGFNYEGAVLLSGAAPIAADAPPTPWRLSGDVAANFDNVTFGKLEARLGDDEHALTLQGVAEGDFGAAPHLSATLAAKDLNVDALLRAKGAETVAPERAWDALGALIGDLGAERGAPLGFALKISSPAIILGGDTIADVDVSLSAAADAPIALDLQATAPGETRVAAKGVLSPAPASHFKGAVNLDVSDIPRLRGWAAEDDSALAARLAAMTAILPYRAATLTGEADISSASFAGRNLTLGLPRSTLTGDLIWTRAVGADPDRLFLNLQSDALNLEALPDLSATGDFFSGVDLALSLQARALRVDQLGDGPVDSGAVDLTLQKTGEAITLDHLSIANLGGASLTAKGAMKPDERWLNVDLDADRLRDFAGLAGRIAPGWIAETALARAEALSPAKLNIVARANGPVRDNFWAPDSLSARGLVGATRVAANIARAGDGPGLSASLSLDAPDAAPLLKQLGVPLQTARGLSRGVVTARAEGDWSRGLDGEATGQLAGVDLSWRGRAFSPNAIANGAVTLKSTNALPLLAALGVVRADPAASAPADLSADLDWTTDDIAVAQLKGAMAGSNVAGDLIYRQSPDADVAKKTDPPQAEVHGALRFDHLSFGGLAALSLGPPQPIKAGDVWSDQKFSTGLLDPPRADITLNIDKFDLGADLSAKDSALRLKLAEGAVIFDSLSMRLGGGAVLGHATLRRDGANAALSGEIALNAIAIDRPGLDVKLSGSLDFAATGQTADGLVAGLAGSGALQLANAQIARLDPDALSRLLAKTQAPDFELSNIDLNRTLGVEMDRRPMQIEDASAPAALSAGVLRTGPFQARHAAGEAKAEISFDFRRMTLDVRTAISERQTPKYWSGAPPAISVVAKGPLNALSREIDTASLANGLEAQAIARETERIADFEADVRERAAFNRRLKAFRFLRQRELELEAYAQEQARLKSEADRRRVEEETLRASEDARKAEQARKAQEEARKEEEARKADEDRKAADEARKILSAPLPPPAPASPTIAPSAPTALQPPPKPPPRPQQDPTATGLY
jgi:uncharacterized protein involved in outer membrane biogenesis